MDDLKKKARELEGEVRRLKSELEKADERAQDLEDTRKAMLFLLEDINESKADILKAKNEWEITFDSISDPLYIHDDDMRIVRCNRAYQEAAGVPFRDIIGRPYYEVFPKMEGPFAGCLKNLHSSEGAAKEEEEDADVPYLNRVFKVKFFFRKDEESGKNYSIHVLEDITEERKTAEKEKTLYNFSLRAMANQDIGYRLRVICETAVEFGYMMAWVGVLKEDTREVVSMAYAGHEEGYLSLIAHKDLIQWMPSAGLAIRSRKPEVVNHLDEGPVNEQWREEAVKRGYRSMASFPVMEEEDVVAVLSIFSGYGDFRERDVDLLMTFANHAAAYIKASWLFTKLKESTEKIREEMELTRHLLMIAEATANTTDIEKLMEKVVDRLQGIMNCDLCLSYLLDKERKVFTPCCGKGLTHEAVPVFKVESLDAGAPFIKGALDSKGPFLYRPAQAFDAGAAAGWVVPGWADGVSLVAVIPLFGKEDTLGVLLCAYKGESSMFPLGFNGRDAAVLNGISSQASTALEVARLYKDSIDKTMSLSRKVEVIQAMHEIDMNILTLLDPGEILETAARMVGKLVFCDRSTIALVDREGGGLKYAAGFGLSSIKKGTFTQFKDTDITGVIKTGRPQYTADLREVKDILPLERTLQKEGFLSHIRVPLTAKGEIIGVLSVGAKRPAAFTAEDLSTIEKLSSQISVALDNSRLLTDLKELFIGTVKTLSKAIDAKSPWTSGHSERVTAIALNIGRELGLNREELRDLELAGLLHDIGKLGTYEHILDKPGRLTEEELKIMRQHPSKGAEILEPIKEFKKIVPAIRHHHECYDGKGYPEGLKGDDIPLTARILSVADTVDAMGADRPYRKGRTMEQITAELKRCSGTQFDPVLIKAYLRTLNVKAAS